MLLGLFFVSSSEVSYHTDIGTKLERNTKVNNWDLKYYFLSLICQCCYLRLTQSWKPPTDVLLPISNNASQMLHVSLFLHYKKIFLGQDFVLCILSLPLYYFRQEKIYE